MDFFCADDALPGRADAAAFAAAGEPDGMCCLLQHHYRDPADLSSSQSAVGVRARVCAQPQCLCSMLCACAQCAGVRCGP